MKNGYFHPEIMVTGSKFNRQEQIKVGTPTHYGKEACM